MGTTTMTATTDRPRRKPFYQDMSVQVFAGMLEAGPA
jgi:hypothetical protein